MGGGRDKKKANQDPFKKAALAAKKDAKAEKAALKRLQKETSGGATSCDIHEVANGSGATGNSGKGNASSSSNNNNDWDLLLESYRNRTKELTTPEFEILGNNSSSSSSNNNRTAKGKNEAPFPSPPRGNFSWTLVSNINNNGVIYMFGGEYYDGSENLVFDELLKWDIPDATYQKKKDDDNDHAQNQRKRIGRWTRILTPSPSPPPRCAHTAVHHDNSLYIFGGEHATSEKYHHYKDLWQFDMKQNTWTECKPISGSPPSARSGHRAVVWRHSMILFGGFHESNTSVTKWYNDTHIYDFQTRMWTELKYGKLARLPSPRSACNLAVCPSSEVLFVYGGYTRMKNNNVVVTGNSGGGGSSSSHGVLATTSKSESIVHVDCWMLPLKSLANGGNSGGGSSSQPPPSWERITRKGEYPSPRAGTSSVTYKNRMLVFGGVADNEGDHHKLSSIFYDDLFALDMERRRWFAMSMKQADVGGGSSSRRRRKKVNSGIKQYDVEEDSRYNEESDGDSEDDITTAIKNEEMKSSGWDFEQLRHDLFAVTVDGNGNSNLEKIERKDTAVSSHKSELITIKENVTNDDGNNPTAKALVDDKTLLSSARRTPLPRINCATVIRNNTLYIYGGLLEVGDREVTLDDCWSFDLNKRDQWTCIWPGQMHRLIWRGVDSDNDSSNISSDQGGDGGEEDSSDDADDAVEFEPIVEGDAEGESEEAWKKVMKEAKKVEKKERSRAIRHEIKELKAKLGADSNDHDQRTPLMNETVADFYSRTSEHWNIKRENSVTERGEIMTSEKMKHLRYQLAKEQYDKVKPIVDRLVELESLQLERKEQKEKKEKKEKKKSEKKAKRDGQ